jgi:glycosyltransferase involved in cell wall biosynthesis
MPPINVGLKNADKKVLICYARNLFKKKKKIYHTNYNEAGVIREIFLGKGYSVDVIGYDAFYPVNYRKYDMIFGFGDVFEKAFSKDTRIKKIHYATGACSLYQDIAEVRRIKHLRERVGVVCKPRRLVGRTWPCSIFLSDAIICLGNDWTISTFPCRENVYKLNATSLGYWKNGDITRDWSKAKKNFLFFGGMGAIHKGLDLFLEVAKQMGEEYVFHFCGALESEGDFLEYYNQHFKNSENIIYHGYKNVTSLEFKEVLTQCGFVVLLSCSEGMATSVLTCMYSGLIPIVTKQCGVDVGDFGVLLEEDESLELSFKQISALPNHQLERKSKNASKSAMDKHSIDQFEKELSVLINKVILEEGSL